MLKSDRCWNTEERLGSPSLLIFFEAYRALAFRCLVPCDWPGPAECVSLVPDCQITRLINFTAVQDHHERCTINWVGILRFSVWKSRIFWLILLAYQYFCDLHPWWTHLCCIIHRISCQSSFRTFTTLDLIFQLTRMTTTSPWTSRSLFGGRSCRWCLKETWKQVTFWPW